MFRAKTIKFAENYMVTKIPNNHYLSVALYVDS